MHKIKEMLMEELYQYEEKAKKSSGGKLSAGDLETLHKLTDTIKNIDKIEMLEEDGEGGYSEATDFMGEGRMYGMSYARGGRGRGRNARRDSMGRYSREGGSSYEGGGSYARGGQGGGRGGSRGGSSYAGGYSMDDGAEHMIEKAEELLESAETQEQRRAIHRFIKELEKI